MKTAESISIKKLNKAENALLQEELELAARKFNENFDYYTKNRKNPIELMVWYGRYVAIDRLFGTSSLVESWKLSHMTNLLMQLSTGAIEHYRTA